MENTIDFLHEVDLFLHYKNGDIENYKIERLTINFYENSINFYNYTRKTKLSESMSMLYYFQVVEN